MPLGTQAAFGMMGPQLVQAVYIDTSFLDTTTTSTTFVDLLSVTLTISDGTDVRCAFSAGCSCSSSNTNIRFQLVIDGVAARGTKCRQDSGAGNCASLTYVDSGLGFGSHTFKIQWSVSGGTGRIRALTVNEEHAALLIEELRT